MYINCTQAKFYAVITTPTTTKAMAINLQIHEHKFGKFENIKTVN